jgi:predicted dehydrogenase
MSTGELGIGIVGYGDMAKAHAYAYAAAPVMRELPHTPRVRALSGRNREAVAEAARRYGVPESCTDWRELVERPDVDVVDVCTPPGTHAEIVAGAAAAGKAVLCEKPLATGYADAAAAVEAVEAAGVLNAIGFNYRRLPALSLMKRMIDAGDVGEPRLWRGTWLSDEFWDPGIPFDWRFERRMGGSTIAELGSHLVDLALWMVGGVEGVAAQSRTFTATRTSPGGEAREVEVDDASSALLRFRGGASGALELARVCVRRPCDFRVEVNGTEGTLAFDYARLNELWYGSARDDDRVYGLLRIRAEHETHPYAADWWPLGQGVGYGASFVNQIADHVAAWPEGPWTPDLATGLRVQAVCDAMELAAAGDRWTEVTA